jgi:GNAT superfamily N-acetyltransferase
MRWGRLDDALVCTRTEDLSTLPELPSTPDLGFREMDMADPDEIATWLAVHNDAFGHTWGVEQFRGAILEHPHFEIRRTFFVTQGDRTLGAASIGVFRRNPRVGVGHYLGVSGEAQSLGLGRLLVLHRYHALRDSGIRECESHTHIGRVRSLRIHFECGFAPKVHFDDWNTPNTATPPVRAITNARLKALYRRWQREQAGRGEPGSTSVHSRS